MALERLEESKEAILNAYLKRFGLRYDEWLSIIYCERDYQVREKLLIGWLESKKKNVAFNWRDYLYPRQRRLF